MAEIVINDPDVDVDLTAEYEQLFQTVFERSDEGIIISEPDAKGRIIQANQAAADMHGYTIEEFSKLKASDLHRTEDLESSHKGLEQMLLGEWIENEHEHYRKDKSTFPVRYRAGVTQYLGRKVIISFVRDVTGEKQMRTDLAHCEVELAALF